MQPERCLDRRDLRDDGISYRPCLRAGESHLARSASFSKPSRAGVRGTQPPRRRRSWSRSTMSPRGSVPSSSPAARRARPAPVFPLVSRVRGAIRPPRGRGRASCEHDDGERDDEHDDEHDDERLHHRDRGRADARLPLAAAHPHGRRYRPRGRRSAQPRHALHLTDHRSAGVCVATRAGANLAGAGAGLRRSGRMAASAGSVSDDKAHEQGCSRHPRDRCDAARGPTKRCFYPPHRERGR